MLTVINFPRKQIGRTMSDCLTTGVLPSGPEVSDKEKRENTVYVRPFIGKSPTAEMIATRTFEPGSKVGVLGEGGLVETNPRDLSWDEFMTMKIVVGKVLSIGATPPSDSTTPPSDRLDAIPLKVDFGIEVGQKESLVHLRPGFISPEELVGTQVLAVVNLVMTPSTASTDGENHDGEGTALGSGGLVLTVGGKTTVEPAHEVQNGFRLG
jgi:hypothetical protein